MPEKDEAQALGLGDTITEFTTTAEHHQGGYTHDTARRRQCADYATGLRRRRAASRRLEALEHVRMSDPWRPWRPETLSDKQLDGAAAAAKCLAEAGLAPLFDAETLRGLWRRGGDHRVLAEELHRLADGVVA